MRPPTRADSCMTASAHDLRTRLRPHHPRRPQPRLRRRVHVLRARRGQDRHGRPHVRARAAGHRDAEPARAARRARGHGRLDPRLRLPQRPLRAAAARRVDGRPVRTAPRARTRPYHARRRPRQAHRHSRPAHQRLPRAAAVRAGLRGGVHAVRRDRGRRAERATSTSGCSSTRDSSPTATAACTSSSTWANGGSRRRACRSRSAATSSARISAPDLVRTVSTHLRASIAYALDHRAPALDHAMQYARGLDPAKADTFVGMYVNDWTLDYGERGREAVRLFLQRGVDAGLITRARRRRVRRVVGEQRHQLRRIHHVHAHAVGARQSGT